MASLVLAIASFNSCSDDDDNVFTNNNNNNNDTTGVDSFTITVNMRQMSNGMPLRLNTVDMPYSNKKGQAFNVSRLRYLISDIRLIKDDNSSIEIEGYHLVDITDSTTMTYNPSIRIPEGNYRAVAFTFGFDEEDNIDGGYPDLNTASWNWPSMLGGGYHNMQFEGRYDSAGVSKPFATHMGTARDISVDPPVFMNNSVDIELANSSINVTEDFSIEITMNMEQWYENPFEWDFNVWNAPIMPIFDAQLRLNDNASSVFSFN